MWCLCIDLSCRWSEWVWIYSQWICCFCSRSSGPYQRSSGKRENWGSHNRQDGRIPHMHRLPRPAAWLCQVSPVCANQHLNPIGHVGQHKSLCCFLNVNLYTNPLKKDFNKVCGGVGMNFRLMCVLPYSLQPCMHTFCAACYSGWMERSSFCPTCRCPVERIRKNHILNNLVEAYLLQHPGTVSHTT